MLLKADQVELAILNLVVDYADPAGLPYGLSDYRTAISCRMGLVSDTEIVDALLVLSENRMIALGRYVGFDLVACDPMEGTQFFYRGKFRCKAFPKARRRQQELSIGSCDGIFISHIAEEQAIALRLQALFQAALSPTVPVFVSSDYKSIESGDKWYEAILHGLKRSQIVVVLLSPASIDRRWINFEAGIGIAQNSRVIPVVSRGLQKNEVGQPLGQLHARALGESDDLRALIDDIGTICNLSASAEPIPDFINDLSLLEMRIPATALLVTVCRCESALYLTIRNNGGRPLDMIDAELLIPEQLRGHTSFHDYPPVRETKRYEEDGVRWIGHRLTTQASHQAHLGINPLPETLLRAMGEVHVSGLRIGLPPNLSAAHEALPIRYRVSARQESVGPVAVPISQIPLADRAKR
jgi:hypothetical protein